MKNYNILNKSFILPIKILVLLIFIFGGFFICSGASQADSQVDMTQETAENFILDGFPFIFDNNFNSFNNVSNGFNSLPLNSDNPFLNALDRSIYLENNWSNNQENLADYLQPISGNGFSVSWWFKWIDYSGSGFIAISDQSTNILLKGCLGINANQIYAPSNTGGISWYFYNLEKSEMGDGAWHQFIIASDGHLITVYMDGQAKAQGVFNDPIDYTGAEADYLKIGGSGAKNFDEIILWDKYISESDANLIYNYGSFSEYIEIPPCTADMTQGNAADFIVDGFPFSSNNNYNSLNGLTGDFDVLPLNLDNPFLDASDRSLFLDNNWSNYPAQLSEELGPLLSGNLTLSWWFKWVDYSGTGHIVLKDSLGRILFNANLGQHGDAVYAPDNTGGMFWEFNNLDRFEMGDGSWHQFALTSNGYYMDIYMDGEIKARGTYNNFIDYAGKQISYLRISGSGWKTMDEILVWDRYFSANDADLIYQYGSFKDYNSDQNLDPVIIVPGIMGSYLYDQAGDEVWPNVVEMLLPLDLYLNKLILPENGEPEGNSIMRPTDIFREIAAKDFFQGLITELENNGYTENENLFVFPYDWRWPIKWAGGADHYPEIQSLYEKIEEIKNKTGAEKVNIIAHSMGGLVAKYYIKHYGNDSVNKFIDIATPHLGSPKAFKILMYGDDLGFSFMNIGFVNIGLSQHRVQSISQNFPSVYQLLPSQSYFNQANQDYSYFIADIHDLDNNGIKGSLNYAESIEFMANTGRNEYLLGFNNDLHNDIDSYSPQDNGIATYNIAGCGQPTIGKIYTLNKEKSGGYEYGLKYINGDSTVPLRSAEYLQADSIYYANNPAHAYLPSANGIKQLVVSILNNEQNEFNFADYENLSEDKNICSFSGTQISFHSPIELHVYDENNNHVGLDENGDIEMGIPGIQYDIIDDNKFAFLPAGHNYIIIGRAAGIGSFNVRIQNVDNGQYGQTVYYNEIPLQTLNSNVQFVVSHNQESYVMQVDQDGDQIFESEVQPSSILSEDEAGDLTKPTTDIIITGEQNLENKYINIAKIELIGQDNENGSGILKIEYSLDNGQTWLEYEEAIILDQVGEYHISYSSTDRAGNIEITKEANIEIKIINIDSIILEIEEFYNQRMITKEKVKRQLIRKLEWIMRYIERYDKRREKQEERFSKIIERCVKKHTSASSAHGKSLEWCEDKFGSIFEKITVKLDNIHKKIIVRKYKVILKFLERYHKKQWINDWAYDIIKEDIKWLIEVAREGGGEG